MRSSSPSTITTSGATIAPGAKPPKSPLPRAHGDSKPSTGAAASTPPSGASPSCSTGSATIPKSAPASPPRWNIATWWPPSSAASPTPSAVPRSICAMGHKWMWNASLGGLPPEEFLAAVDPLLAGVRAKLAGRYATSDQIAGHLSAEWAARLGLRAGIPIPVGAFDAHWDAIGAGVRLGDVVNVVGTSTCIIAIGEQRRADPRRLRRGARLGRPAAHRHRSRPLRHRRYLRRHRPPRRYHRGRTFPRPGKLPRRPDRPAAPHLGQRRPHRPGESRT